jgi:hypothetical protein
MPSRPTSRRGGYRENSGRRKALFHEDPDRFFVALWRELIRYLGHEKAARLAAHFLAAEPIDMADVEGGALRIMSTKIAHHTDDLDNYLFSLVRKARTAPNDDAWLAASQAALSGLIAATIKLIRPDLAAEAAPGLTADIREWIEQLRALGWGEKLARFEARFSAAMRSNLPPFEGALGRGGRRLLRERRGQSKKKSGV